MQKLKNFVKRFVKKDSFLYKVIRKIYHTLSTFKYKITNNKKIKEERRKFSEQANKAIEKLKQYKDKDYVVFYNPTWLGVANSTKGLFENIVPLEHVYNEKDIKNVAKAINENNIKTAIFSQICDGWTSIIKNLKKENKDIQIKVIWHGNCYEFFSDFTWNLNKEVMELYKENVINSFGFVRSIMYEFYKKVGFKSYYLQNNVNMKNDQKIESNNSIANDQNAENNNSIVNAQNAENNDSIVNDQNNKKGKDNKKPIIGIYNADSRELKNIYTSLSAIKLLPDAIADVVPINAGATEFANILNLEITSINDYIPYNELMERIQKNDVNIYPTFTENAPMFPIESFEMGVPCLLGNNNDYFVGTKLGEYVILEKEDDAQYIKEKIEKVLENKEEIMDLYKQWKKDFDEKCKELVKEFVKL